MMLDQELRREDIQGLRDADALAALFASLGFRTDARLLRRPRRTSESRRSRSPARSCVSNGWPIRKGSCRSISSSSRR